MFSERFLTNQQIEMERRRKTTPQDSLENSYDEVERAAEGPSGLLPSAGGQNSGGTSKRPESDPHDLRSHLNEIVGSL